MFVKKQILPHQQQAKIPKSWYIACAISAYLCSIYALQPHYDRYFKERPELDLRSEEERKDNLPLRNLFK